MPKADATGLAPEESADYTPSRTRIRFVREGTDGLVRFVPRCFYFPRYTPQPTR
jgi:hypothetical protein